MVVGSGTNRTMSHLTDAHYPHPILREDLAMKFRGVSNLTSLLAYYRITKTVHKLTITHAPSALHAARPLFEGLVARLIKIRTGIPYLCFVHGEDINVAMTSRELKYLTASVLNNATKVIANSDFTKNLLLSDWNVASDRIEMMHPGVDCEYFSPANPTSLRRLFPPNRKILLTVGRLQQRKGHDALIYGLQTIRHAFPDVLYAIAGDGEQRLFLEDLVARLSLSEHVKFLGEIDDETLRQCYRECDLFVLPNRAVGHDIEGFGMVLLEAQACGKPVVAGKSGGTSDTLDVGKTGFLIDCQNPEKPDELVSTICRLLTDDAERNLLGDQARRFVQRNFDWSTLAEQAKTALKIDVVNSR